MENHPDVLAIEASTVFDERRSDEDPKDEAAPGPEGAPA